MRNPRTLLFPIALVVSVLGLLGVALADAPLGYYRQPAIHGDTLVFVAEGDLWRVPVSGGIVCTKGGGANNLTANEYRHAATQRIKAGADGVYLFYFFTSRE